MQVQRGTIVDRSFVLDEQLGEGGMGAVYRATQLTSKQTVALKLVHSQSEGSVDLGADAVQQRLALAREFQTLASLHHPNIIRVLSYGFDEQLGPYFTMELMPSPQGLLAAAAEQSEEGKVGLIAQLLRALAYVHRRSVIHRDIKPSNVLVVGGEAKLLDFGIAVARGQQADFAGTVEYMAPELLSGGQPGVASDLYAAGMLLYQMLDSGGGAGPEPPVSLTRALDAMLGEGPDAAPRASEHPTWIEPGLDGSASDSASSEPQLDLDAALDQALDGSRDGTFTPPQLAQEVPGPLGDVVRRLLHPQPAARFSDALEALRALAAAVPYPLAIETLETRESFLRATPLIGREAELSTLTSALESAAHRHGAAVLLGGESGVGKSRLISELRTQALVHGAWVSDGQSTAEGGAYYQEFLPLLRELCFRTDMTDEEAAVLRDLLPDIGQLLGRTIPAAPPIRPEAVQGRIAQTLIALLQRLSKPLVLILEDLQWARSESLALLSLLAQQRSGLPLLLVGTYRIDEKPELPRALPDMQLLRLSRLDEGEVAALSTSMLGPIGRKPELTTYLVRQTEGNVFFLVEIVRALAEDAGELERIGQGSLPETVLTQGIERIIDRRLDAVPPDQRPVLELAATLGRQLDLKVLAHAFPSLALPSFLLRCANAAILESQGSDWRFAHDKLREALLRRFTPELRKERHHKVAATIEAVYDEAGCRARAALLAYHYAQAGRTEPALRYYLIAGDEALRLALLAEARSHLAEALQLLDKLPSTPETQRLTVDTLLKQARASLMVDSAETQLGRLERARALLTQACGGVEPQGEDRTRLARIHYFFGRVHNYVGQPSEAIKYYKLVLPVAQELGDQELLVLPSFLIGLALCFSGKMGAARRLLSQAMGPIEKLGMPVDWQRCVLFHALAAGEGGDYQGALAEMERAHANAEQMGQKVLLSMSALMHSALHRSGADFHATLRTAERVVELSRQTNEKVYLFAGLSLVAWSHSFFGRHDVARVHRQEAIAIAQGMGGRVSTGDWFDASDAELALLEGRNEQALTIARERAPIFQKSELLLALGVVERAWGCALSRLGASAAESDAHLTQSIEVCRAGDMQLGIAQAHMWWARMCRERGEEADAQRHLDVACEGFRAARCEPGIATAQGFFSRD